MKPILFIAFLAFGPALAELTPPATDGPVAVTVSSVDAVEALPAPANAAPTYPGESTRSASLTGER